MPARLNMFLETRKGGQGGLSQARMPQAHGLSPSILPGTWLPSAHGGCLSASLRWVWMLPLGSDPVTITCYTYPPISPSPCPRPRPRPPEIVSGGHIVVLVPSVQAAEGVPGQAEGGSPVQVAVPFDLDPHDAALWVASRDKARFP